MTRLRPCLAALCLAVASVAQAASFSFAAIGDVPYGSPEELAELAARVNREPVAFTIHVGDIKSGGSRCSDEAFLRVRQLFDNFEQPLVYTPGDNEWTDCHRKSCGAYDPLERLAKLRSLFFAGRDSLGRTRIALQSQGNESRYARYVENRRWSRGKVTFATLHLVGSNNNLQPELPSVSEFAARDDANIAWLRESFAAAKGRNDVAVVLAMQADTFFAAVDERSGFRRWLAALAEEVAQWARPVLLIQGDTHVYRIDHPLKGADGKPLPQVLRVVVPGERDADAVIIDVDDERASEPFRLRRLRGTEPIN